MDVGGESKNDLVGGITTDVNVTLGDKAKQSRFTVYRPRPHDYF